MNLGPYALDEIYTGDARELARAIPDESVDLVFTDPVYWQIEDYEWLGREAARVLKPDRACLVWGGLVWIDQHIDALRRGGLTYRWIIVWYQSNNMRIYSPVFNKWAPCYWMEKGKSKPHGLIQDLRNVPLDVGNDRQDNHHGWAKRSELIDYYLNAFCPPGGIVWEPFCGGGTVPAMARQLCRHYLAFEIDPATAERARLRVANTQPPLFVPEPEQMEMTL